MDGLSPLGGCVQGFGSGHQVGLSGKWLCDKFYRRIWSVKPPPMGRKPSFARPRIQTAPSIARIHPTSPPRGRHSSCRCSCGCSCSSSTRCCCPFPKWNLTGNGSNPPMCLRCESTWGGRHPPKALRRCDSFSHWIWIGSRGFFDLGLEVVVQVHSNLLSFQLSSSSASGRGCPTNSVMSGTFQNDEASAMVVAHRKDHPSMNPTRQTKGS